MEALLTLLQESVSGMQADAAVIAENYKAMNTMGDDIVAAVVAHSEAAQAKFAAERRARRDSLTFHDVTV